MVSAETAHRMKQRAIKFMKSPITFLIGVLLKQFLEELDLWEEREDEEA